MAVKLSIQALMNKGQNKELNRVLSFIICAITLLGLYPSVGWSAPQPPKIKAYSAVLVDADTGKVVFEKRCHERRPPASTTKMMTAILALEHLNLNDWVCASTNCTTTPFTSLHLKTGEQLTAEDLLYGTLLRSANDGAVCIAENVAGSQGKFVKMMNKKAKELGLHDTHFVNPHGLYNPKHYSSAYDLAVIAQYAIKFPFFNEVVKTKRYRLQRSINTKDIAVKNTATFLWKYAGADGIKTGYTKEAGHCFVGSATRGGWRLISVVMKSPKAGEDTAALMNYGFKFFKQVPFAKENEVVTNIPVAGGVTNSVPVVASSSLGTVVQKAYPVTTDTKLNINPVSAPIKKGEKLGTLTGYMNGTQVGTVDLIAGDSVDRTLASTLWLYVRSVCGIAGIFVVGYMTYGYKVAKSARRRRRSIAARG